MATHANARRSVLPNNEKGELQLENNTNYLEKDLRSTLFKFL